MTPLRWAAVALAVWLVVAYGLARLVGAVARRGDEEEGHL